jgi:hypothetical protein
MIWVIYAECHIKGLYAECHYAEWRYAECRGALYRQFIQFFFFLNFFAKFGQVPRSFSQRRSPFNGLRARIQTKISRSVLLLLNYVYLVTKLASLFEKCHVFWKMTLKLQGGGEVPQHSAKWHSV